MSAALLGGMQANATRQMGLLGRIEQRWGVFRYALRRRNGRGSGDPPEGVHQAGQIRHDHGDGRDVGDEEQGHHHDRAVSERPDRKSTRLNSSHVSTSYAVLCLKQKISKLNKIYEYLQ